METQFFLSRLRRAAGSVVFHAVLIAFSLTCVFPIIWIGYSSLKSLGEFERDIIKLPESPGFENFAEVFRKLDMPSLLFNSFFNTSVSLVFIVLLGFILAYPLARFRFPGRNIVYTLLMFGMLIPIHGIMVPLFIQFQQLGIYNTRLALPIPYIAFGLPMTVFLMESYIRSIPRAMEEAAAIEGMGYWGTMFRIIWPMCGPVAATVLVLQFFSRWNEFAFALILVRDKALQTLPLGLTVFSSDYSTQYTQLMAALIISIAPVVTMYLIFSKKVMEGMTAGAVK